MSQQKSDPRFSTDGEASKNDRRLLDGASAPSPDGALSMDGQPLQAPSSISSTTTTAHKATFYMRPETIEALEELWMTVRKRVGPAARASITKSLLVETALKLLIEDLKDSDRAETLKKLEITVG